MSHDLRHIRQPLRALPAGIDPRPVETLCGQPPTELDHTYREARRKMRRHDECDALDCFDCRRELRERIEAEREDADERRAGR